MMGSTSLYNLRPQLSVHSQPFVKFTLRIYYTSSLISIYLASIENLSKKRVHVLRDRHSASTDVTKLTPALARNLVCM